MNFSLNIFRFAAVDSTFKLLQYDSCTVVGKSLKLRKKIQVLGFRLATISTTCYSYESADPAPIFFMPEVQNLLQNLTEIDFAKITKKRMVGQKLFAPKYEFLTDEQLKERTEQVQAEANRLLQMPPVMKVRNPEVKCLSRDVAIKGAVESKMIFTDISPAVSDRDRVVVVRETDGILREATWEEKEQMNRIYFPRTGRSFFIPAMFEEEHLKDVLAREEYLFVLDRACAQFEPDDEKYQEAVSATYNVIDERHHYERLLSTRHYGPLCFYYAWHKQMDNLLIAYIKDEKIARALEMVKLYHIIHSDCQSAKCSDLREPLKVIESYAEHDSAKKDDLMLAVRAYHDILRRHESYGEEIRKVHGV